MYMCVSVYFDCIIQRETAVAPYQIVAQFQKYFAEVSIMYLKVFYLPPSMFVNLLPVKH